MFYAEGDVLLEGIEPLELVLACEVPHSCLMVSEYLCVQSPVDGGVVRVAYKSV